MLTSFEMTGLERMSLPSGADGRLVRLVEAARAQMAQWCASPRWQDMRRVRDQLEGGARALAPEYHPDIPGLKLEQQQRVRQARRHVNLAEAALDRLVNSIHAGRITRKSALDEGLSRLLRKPAHAEAMATLAEDAFAYGTGVLVPIVKGANGTDGTDGGTGLRARVGYWHPDPLWSVLVVDARNVRRVWGVVEQLRDVTDTQTVGVRFVTEEIEGDWIFGEEPLVVEHGLGFLPVVIARGRSGKGVYGRSLILPAADGSIRVTNNELNLELLRDRQTQALLLIWGMPSNSAEETKESLQKYFLWRNKEEGGAEYIQPESRLEDVIRVTERFCVDVSVSTGLPLDTFLPERVAGSDASATAARNRAFPLQQRMVRLNASWVRTELAAAGVIGGQLAADAVAGLEAEEVAEALGVTVSILPSLPEAEAETLAGWQQKTEKFFAPVEQAIEYYSGDLGTEEKEALAAEWRKRFQDKKPELFQYHIEQGVLTVNEARRWLELPPVEGGDERAADLAFLREVARAFLGDGTVADVAANLTALRELWDRVGIPREEGYEEPWLPVADDQGRLVTGEVVVDGEGDVVGGDVEGGGLSVEGGDPPSP